MWKNANILLIFMLAMLILAGCSSNNSTETGETEYPPMAFVDNTLYIDKGETVTALSQDWENAGRIETLCSNMGPMKKENFTSNTLPEGTEIFMNVAEPGIIYLQISSSKFLKFVEEIEE